MCCVQWEFCQLVKNSMRRGRQTFSALVCCGKNEVMKCIDCLFVSNRSSLFWRPWSPLGFMSATKRKKRARHRLFNVPRHLKLEYSPALLLGTSFLSRRFHEMKHSRSLFGRLHTCTANIKSTVENLS